VCVGEAIDRDYTRPESSGFSIFRGSIVPTLPLDQVPLVTVTVPLITLPLITAPPLTSSTPVPLSPQATRR
jgi:hypothetical protein